MPQIMTRVGPIDLRYDNILMLKMGKGIDISQADVNEIHTAIHRLTSEKLPLIVIAGSHSLSLHAQQYFATTQAFSKLVMVLGKKQTRQIYQFLTEVFRPVYEMKIFNALNKAIAWVKKDNS